jgi:hypothetical protein
MKKFLVVAAALFTAALFSTASVNAQDVKGKNFVNAGIGIGTFGFSGTGGLPITASFEHGFTDKISAGGYVGIVQRKFLTDYKYSYFVVGARGSYHFSELLNITNEKVDVYGGASLYYRGYKLKYGTSEHNDLYKASGGTIGLALHAAARYMFSEKIGGYAELGYGISPLQLGVSFKF